MFFDFKGEIKYVQFYDLTNKRVVKHDGVKYVVGSVITEVEHREGMLLPQPNTIVRFDSGEYTGFYTILSWMYLDNTGVLRITVEKNKSIDPYRGACML